jgi:hypothetical protein
MPPLGKRKTATLDPELLLVSDLSAGVDLRRSPSLLKANRARRLRNWSLEEPGALVSYPGWASFSTASLGTGRVQGGQRIYLAGSTFTLAGAAGSVYKPSDAGAWGAAVLAGLHATNQIYFVHDRDMVVVLDGSSVSKKSVNGTTWTQLGISAPTVAPTAAVVAGGSLTNLSNYEFSYSFVDDGLVAESDESATVQQAAGGAGLTIRLTVTGPADPQVDTIYIYARDVTAGELIRRKVVGSVANPGSGLTTTFDVTTKNWTTGVEAPTDHDVAPALAFGVLWKNRLWARDAVVKNRLRFSQLFEPQSFPTLFFIDIPFERGDEIAAMVAYGDTLVCFGQASKPFLIIGQTSLDFEVRPSAAAEAGALGPRAVDVVENGILHAAAEGVYLFDGASDRLLSYDIDPGWKDLVEGATVADLARISLKYHRARKEVRIAVPRLYPYGTAGEWVLDLNRTRLQEEPAWTSTDRTVGGYIHWDGNEASVGDRGRLFSWSDTILKLYEEAVGTTADGSDLVADYEGPTFTTGLPMARFIELFGEYRPASGAFALEVVVDGVSRFTHSVTINAGVATYGTATYGVDTYGGVGRKPFVTLLPTLAEGRSVFLRSTYAGQGSFSWFSYAMAVITEQLPRGI